MNNRKILIIFLLLSSISAYSEENRLTKIDLELHTELTKNQEKNKIDLSQVNSEQEHLTRYIKEMHDILRGKIPLYNKEGKKDDAKDFLNSLDTHGKTPLMYAIQCKDSKSVEEMLKYGANPNVIGNDNRTALFYALELADESAFNNKNEKNRIQNIINLLLEKGASADYSYNSLDGRYINYYPLIAACRIKDTTDLEYKKSIIESILRKTKVIDQKSSFYISPTNYEITPLAYLLQLQQSVEYKEIIEQLLHSGADSNKVINCKDFSGKIFQYLCANYTSNLDSLLEILINNEADIDSDFSYKGENLTPLICAIRTKNTDFIRLILANIRSKDNARKKYLIKDSEGNPWECSAIHIVAKYGDKVLYKEFKDTNINNKQQDSRGKTALDYLKDACKNEVDELFLTYEMDGDDKNAIINAIQKIKNIKEDTTSDRHQTALQIMLLCNDEKNAIALLSRFDENNNLEHILLKTDNDDKNAFDYAISTSSKEVIKWFIDKHFSAGQSIFSIIDKVLETGDDYFFGVLESFLRIENNPNKLEKRFDFQNKNFIEVNPIVYTSMIINDNSKTQLQIQIIDKLLENKFDLNKTARKSSEEGNSALIYAVKYNNNELAKYLIDKGINLELASKPTTGGNNYGKTALFYALENKNDYIVENIIKTKEYKILDIELPGDKSSLLMYFAMYSTPQILKALLPYYIQENKDCMLKKDNQGMTAFLWAIKANENMEVARLLRIYGANVFDVNKNNENAIKIAKTANGNKDEKIKRLISWGVEND